MIATRPLPFVLAIVAVLSTHVGGRQQVFSARAEAVRVDVLVTDRRQLVRGLTPKDFEVFENGVPQTVDFATFEHLPVNVIVAFDMSGSVSGERLGQLQSASRMLLDRLKSGDRAGGLTFNHVVTVRASLTADLALARSALDHPDIQGETALVDASFSAMMIASGDSGRSLVIVFSDGVDTASWLTPDAVIDTAKRSDAVAYGVAAGTTTGDPFLRRLSEQTGGSLLKIQSTKDLGATFVRILDEFRDRYVISYSPRGVTAGGWHRIEVRVKDRRYEVKARPGYLSGN